MEHCPNSVSEGKKHTSSFWNNKPVTNYNEIVTQVKTIEQLNTRKVYSQEQLKLPSSLDWKLLNLYNSNDLANIVTFLNTYMYNNEKFSTSAQYTTEYVKWLLGPKGSVLAIVTKQNNEICGLIGGKPKKMTIFNAKSMELFDVVFLCAQEKYRKKKMCFVLIDEFTRLCVQQGYNNGIFCTNRCVPTPTSIVREYCRPLNYKKIYDLKHIQLQDSKPETLNKFVKMFSTSDKICSRFVPMQMSHVDEALKIYMAWNDRFNIFQEHDKESFVQYFLTHEHVKSYVILNDNNNIIDFMSFYVVKCNNDVNIGKLLTYTACTETLDSIIAQFINITSSLDLDLITVPDTTTIAECLLFNDIPCDGDSDKKDGDLMYEYKFIKTNKKMFVNFFNLQTPKVFTKQINISIVN